MNKSFIALVVFFLLGLFLAVSTGISFYSEHRLEKELMVTVKQRLDTELETVTQLVRNPILLGNIREARTLLTGLSEGGLLGGFSVVNAKGETLASYNATDESLTLSLKQSISFSPQGGEPLWGYVEYRVKPGELSILLKQSRQQLWQTIGFLTLVFLFSCFIFFSLLQRMSHHLVVTIRQFADSFSTIPASPWFAWSWKPFFSVLGKMSDELTTLKRLAEESKRNAIIASTVQTVVHDVRRPFQQVKLLLSGLGSAESRAGHQLDPDLSAFLSTGAVQIHRSMARVENLLSDLLEIGKPAKYELRECDLASVFRDSLEIVTSGRSLVDIEVTFEAGECKVLGRDDKIERVFTNVIANGIEALSMASFTSNRKKALWFRCAEVKGSDEAWVICALGNSGPAIPAERLEAIFEPFVTSGKKGGTGLGLFIARKIMREHGGDLTCRSDESLGVEFLLRFRSARAPGKSE